MASSTSTSTLKQELRSQSYDKLLNDLVGNGKLVTAAAILTLSAEYPILIRNIVLAQKGIAVKFAEAAVIAERIYKNKLHTDYVSLGNTQYLITSIQRDGKSFYGRDINNDPNTEGSGGIIIVKTSTHFLIALYPLKFHLHIHVVKSFYFDCVDIQLSCHSH